MNVCHLLGRVITDPVLETTPSGRKICKFKLATANGPDKPATRHNIIILSRGLDDKHPENVANDIRQGARVAITGRISENLWETKTDPPELRSKIEIVCSGIEYISKAPPKPEESENQEKEIDAISE